MGNPRGVSPRDKTAVRLGDNARVDTGVAVGYPPDRPGIDAELVIGTGARIRQGSIIYAGSRIGDNLETGHNVLIREGNVIGNNFSIWSNSVVDYGCRIGNGVKIHSNAYVAQFTVIEDDVFLAPGVSVANDPHPGCAQSKACMRGPTIKRGAQIGVNVTILPFVTIGEHALIGAGSVVTKDVPPGAVLIGNPAKVVGWIGDLVCKTGLISRPYANSGRVPVKSDKPQRAKRPARKMEGT